MPGGKLEEFPATLLLFIQIPVNIPCQEIDPEESL
jgi:hypothetical protein